MKTEIDDADKHVKKFGFCVASWQPEVVALATPIKIGTQIYAINVSVSSDEDVTKLTHELAPILMDLKINIQTSLGLDL